jgi:hypothetical protein
MEEESTARHFIVMTEDAVEITVEEHSEIFTFHGINIYVMEWGEGHNLILVEYHLYMVHLDGYLTISHPKKLIQSRVLL